MKPKTAAMIVALVLVTVSLVSRNATASKIVFNTGA